jgi:O-antigen/teichoic acid export membrane protein
MSAVLLVRRHNWLHFGLAHARKSELRRLFKPAMANMAIPLGQALNIQGMVLVVGAVLSPLAVVVFSTLRTLTRLVLQLILTVSHASEPELAAAYGASNYSLMRYLFVHTLRGGLWLALIAAAGMAYFGSLILEIWTHNEVAMEPMLFACLLASATVSVLWYGSLVLLKAVNQHLRAATIYVIVSGVVVGIAMFLLDWTGNLAMAGLALLLMDTVMVLYTLNAAVHLLGIRAIPTLGQAINPIPLFRILLPRASNR